MMINGMWLYWKDQCMCCSKSETCEYKKDVVNYINAISALNKVANNVYGETEYRCDYFMIDWDKYYAENKPEVATYDC